MAMAFPTGIPSAEAVALQCSSGAALLAISKEFGKSADWLLTGLKGE